MTAFGFCRLIGRGSAICASLACVPCLAGTARASFQVAMVIRESCNIDRAGITAGPTAHRPAVSCSHPVAYQIKPGTEWNAPSLRIAPPDSNSTNGVPVYTIIF